MARAIRHVKPLFVLLLLALALPGSVLLAQKEVVITGKITDIDTKGTLPGATVVSLKHMRGALSDEDGIYTVKLPREDTMELRVTYLEFDTLFLQILDQPGVDTIRSPVQLYPKVREAVVITAARHEQKLSEVTISMEVIKPQAVDVQATTNIEDVLQQSPGVDIIDGQPNIRGSSGFAYGVGSRVMVMMDGLPLQSADASFALFDMMPTDNLAQVEIMKGASSVLYGSSALGGVINVITADAPREPMTSVRMRGVIYGPPAVKELDWNGDKNAWGSSINVFHTRRIKNHDFTALVDIIKDTGFRQNTDEEQARAMIMTKFRPEKISGLVFGANAAFRIDSSHNFLYWDSYMPDSNVIRLIRTPTVHLDTGYSGGALTGDPGTIRGQVNWRLTVDPFLKYLTPKGNVHTYRGRILRSANTNDTQQSNYGTMVFNDYQYVTSFWDGRVSWVTGATYIYNRARGDSLYGEIAVDPGTGDTSLVGGAYWSTNGAIYSQLDAKLFPKLNASFGARYDLWYINGGEQYGNKIEQSPVFRLGLNYAAWPGGNIRANAGQGFRSPSIAERFTSTIGGGLIIEPNPDLVAEKGFSAEIAVRQGYRFGTKERGIVGFVDVSGFMMDFRNMIEFGASGAEVNVINLPDTFIIDAAPKFSSRNVSRARIPGVEITGLVSATWDKFRFDLSGGFTYIEPRNLNAAPDSLQVNLRDSANIQHLFNLLEPIGHPNKMYDNPVFLKYRNRFTTRLSTTIGYDRLNLTINYQGKSEIVNIDQFLWEAVKGSRDYDKKNGLSTQLVNMILAYDVLKNLKISFHCNNVFNREWVVLPGIIGEQRKYTLQAKYVF